MGEPTGVGYHHFFYTSLKQYKEELMNHKQKLGYILLGAGIMLVGLTIGAIISPMAVSQDKTFLGDFECRSLTVVNKEGKRVIELGSHTKEGGLVDVRDENGKKGVRLIAGEGGNSVLVSAPGGRESAVSISSEKDTNSILMNWRGQPATTLRADDEACSISFGIGSPTLIVGTSKHSDGIALYTPHGRLRASWPW